MMIVVPVLLAGSIACRAPAVPARVNVVLISIDTLRADRLNAYGYRARRTSPEIDRLAADGILFESHISASPWTVPSHLSLLTSMSPTAHGVTSSFRALMRGLGDEGEHERLADDAVTLAEVLRAGGRATAAFTGGATLDPRIGFGQGFETYDTSMFKMNSRKMDRLLAWVAEHREQSFFLFWHTFETHAPYLDTTYLEEALPGERARRLAHALEKLARASGRKSAREGEAVLDRHGAYTREVCSALYDGGVRAADAWVGALMGRLRALGLYDRTLLVFTSDHGEQLGERMEGVDNSTRGRGIYDTHGHTLYEELVRVPLIVKLPGQRHAGRRVRAVTRAIDVMPTILAAVAASGPPKQMQGTSLHSLWEGVAGPPRGALSEAVAEAFEKKSFRTDQYKYIVSIDRETVEERGRHFVPDRPAAVELYDLVRDPGERRNLLRDTGVRQAAATAAALDHELRRAPGRRGQAASVGLDAATLEQLRSLGYLQ